MERSHQRKEPLARVLMTKTENIVLAYVLTNIRC